MNSALKIGAISGLIAGIIFGIATTVFCNMAVSLGLYEPYFRILVTNNVAVNIPLGIIWGIIFGIIYSRVYNLIPRKGVWKGLIYGLFLYFIIIIRLVTFNLAYGRVLTAAGNTLDFFSWLSFGLVLGILYRFLSDRYYPAKEEPKIITYDVKSGILPGAIAGFCNGMASSVVSVMGPAMGLWTLGVPVRLTFDFWMGQAGAHIFLNMIWGTLFGFMFPKVYSLVPGRGVRKGLSYGLILFSITSFQLGSMFVPWSIFHELWQLVPFFVGATWLVGVAGYTAYGLVLGALYRKPSD